MTTYTVEIQASNGDGTIWQAIEPAETAEASESPAEFAAWVAENQNVAEGEGWRVVVWEGDEPTGDPVAVHDGGTIGEVERLGEERVAAKRAYDKATEALRGAVVDALANDYAEAELARVGQVDRMTVRKWAGK